MVRPAGFEPAASGSGDQRSIQLSYGRRLPANNSPLGTPTEKQLSD